MDIKNLLKQAQQMQSKVQEVQKNLEQKTVVGESGGGAVAITANCKGEVKKVKINKDFIDPNDEIEILEDLILAAFNDAKKKADAESSSSMSNVGLPKNLMG